MIKSQIWSWLNFFKLKNPFLIYACKKKALSISSQVAKQIIHVIN